MAGNPNPSPATRFKPGQSGNPSGRSKEELKAHNKSAKIAARLKLKALSSLQEKISAEGMTEDQVIELLFNGDVLRMFKEVEDRAHGTSTQSVNMESPDGTMSPKPSLDVSKLSTAALAEIMALSVDPDTK